MKRLTSLILCMLLLCGCTKNAETTPATVTNQPPAEEETFVTTPLCDGKTLKILAIGNSFSNNTTQYLYDVAMAEGMTDVTIGRLFIGSCTLEMHAANAQNDTPAYTYYKNDSGTWEKTENVTMLHGLLDESWDIITMQQSSGQSGQSGSYDGHLETLIDYVNTHKTNKDAKLVWHMTWAYQTDSTHKDFSHYANDQLSMYYAIVATCQEKILTNDAFVAVIPAGTAIQNARTSRWGDAITADGYHLNDLGKLTASYMWYATLTGKSLSGIRLDTTYTGFHVSEQTKEIILQSVNGALKAPYQITEVK